MTRSSFVLAFALLLSTFSWGQDFAKIPATHQSHPELGTTRPASVISPLAYELVHLRTTHSRTFLNANKTRTLVYSTAPLHYLNENGFYISLQNRLTSREPGQYQMPDVNPVHHFNEHTGHTGFSHAVATMHILPQKATFVSSGQSQTQVATHQSRTREVSASLINTREIFPGIDMRQEFFDFAQKTHYILHNSSDIPYWADHMVVENLITIPDNLRLVLVDEEQMEVVNSEGDPVFRFHPAVVTDQTPIAAKFSHQRPHSMVQYELEQNTPGQYIWRMVVDAQWLRAPERVFPVIVDPVISIVNNEVVPSCVFPNYQSNTLQINVPQGETILWTDITYDFVAVSGSSAWISDQRSYVSGSAGETAVLSESIDTPGTHTYIINNSHIANGVSPGQIELTFHASRNWGGSGCNASFNFINRRTVEVHYGTIEFGDGPLYINEYSASNRTHHDGFGRTEDWIELFNADTENYFNLEGYYLSNDPDDPLKWQIPAAIIPPGGKVLVYCSNRDFASGTVLHANFNLTQLRPDAIVLSNPQGELMESVQMERTQINHSRGRITDGSPQWGIFTHPTPLQPNAQARLAYTSTPAFSLPAGSYSGTVQVEITSENPNEIIRYTLNGSTPNTSSPIYTAPISLTSTTVLRARAFHNNPDTIPGFIETATYFFDENHQLPIFSFAGDTDLLQLFNGNNSLRPLGNFEFFDQEGVFQDKNFGDFNKHGNDSWSYPQRGVDFISRDDYGYQRRLEYPFFATKDRTRFRRLMVKAAANDNYPFENGGAHIRDSYIQTLSQLAGLDLDERSSTNVIVYLNGQYWGVYDLRERVDDNNFTDHYYGQDYLYRDSDNYLQFIKTWGNTYAHFGNQPAIQAWSHLKSYVASNNMGEKAHFDYVDSQLNIQSLIDYFVLNSFVVSRDWLNYNTGWWRGRNPEGQAQQWRYYVWDMEAAMGHFHNYTGLPNATATAPPCQAENLNVGDGHTQIIRKLIQENPQVRERYITRYIDLLNTHFSYDNAVAVLDSMVNNIAPEMPRQIQRWGGNMQTWQNNVQNIRNFLQARTQYLVNGLKDCYNLTGPYATQISVYPQQAGTVRMNSVQLSDFPFQASLYGNITTQLEAQAATGFIFSHWEINGSIQTPLPSGRTIDLLLTQAGSITAHFVPFPGDDFELIHYWHFNNLPEGELTQVHADFSIAGMPGTLSYPGSGTGFMDIRTHRDEDPVSDFNLRMGQQPAQGAVLRARNPAHTRELLFKAPSTGYASLVVSYAATRTSSGAQKQRFQYSPDAGNTWITFGADMDIPFIGEYGVDPEVGIYAHITLDLSEIEAINNNPDLRFRILALPPGNDNTSGNQRIDNFTVDGIPMGGEAVQLAFSLINDNLPVYTMEPFDLWVMAQDENGLPAQAQQDYAVSLSLENGSGNLSGVLTAILEQGNASVLFEGITYNTAETGVVLRAEAAGLSPAISNPFDVTTRTWLLEVTLNIPDAGTILGTGAYAQGTEVTLEAIPNPGYTFLHWSFQSSILSTQPVYTFLMPASDLTLQAHFTETLPDNYQLVHYWHFNTLTNSAVGQVQSDFSAQGLSALITYPGTGEGFMDGRTHRDADPVSDYNLRLGQAPAQGAVLRFRNPAHTRELRFQIPSTGYKDLMVKYATTRTSNGAQQQQFQYSPDGGTSWFNHGDVLEVPFIGELGVDPEVGVYAFVSLDFSGIEEVNNNPDLYFRILSTGPGSDNSSGNQRIDNFSVDGIPLSGVSTDPIPLPEGKMTLSPNPAHSHVTLQLPEAVQTWIRIVDINGHELQRFLMTETSYQLDVSGLAPGMYIIQALGANTGHSWNARLIIR